MRKTLLIGHWRSLLSQPFSVCMYVLGVTICQKRQRLIKCNFDPVMKTINTSLNIWSQRKLSIFGKIEVVRSQAISRLVYLLTLLPSPPKDYLDNIEKVLFNFIWNNKRAKIQSSVLKT